MAVLLLSAAFFSLASAILLSPIFWGLPSYLVEHGHLPPHALSPALTLAAASGAAFALAFLSASLLSRLWATQSKPGSGRANAGAGA